MNIQTQLNPSGSINQLPHSEGRANQHAVDQTSNTADVAQKEIFEVLKYAIDGFKNVDPTILKIAHRMSALKFVTAIDNPSAGKNAISYYENVSLCNNNFKLNRSSFADEKWKSPLERAISCIFYNKTGGGVTSLLNFRCESCRQCQTDFSLEACPYVIAATVQLFAMKVKTDPDNIFRLLLKDQFREIKQPENVNIEDTEFPQEIDARVALGAYVLLQFGLEETNGLCRVGPDFHMDEIYSAVKGVEYSNNIRDRGNCHECHFSYCPDKAARLIKTYADSNALIASDVAYSLFKMRKGILSDRDWFNTSETYNNVIENIAFARESHKVYQGLIRSIVNHSRNRNIDVNLNMVIHTDDNSVADEIFNKIFRQAVFNYNYYDLPGSPKYLIYNAKKDSNTKLEQVIENLSERTIIYIKDIDAWQDANPDALFQLFEEKLDLVTLVFTGKENALKSFFTNYSRLYHQICCNHLFVNGIKEQTIVNNILKSLRSSLTVPLETEKRIVQYVKDNYDRSRFKNYDYVHWLVNKLKFDHYSAEYYVDDILQPNEIPASKNIRTFDDIMASLNRLVGLYQVKKQIEKINAQILFQKNTNMLSNNGLMHFVFSGNAGTGKTTVAKLMGEILHSIGYLKTDKVVICSGKDLEGAYLGQSAKNTAAKCEEAYGGILFIDEAYQLNPFQSPISVDIYKQDVVNELIQQMENNRDRLMVIFAGYPKDMDEFISVANPGLRSRISETLVFEDYSIDEMIEIFMGYVSSSGLTIDPIALQSVKTNIEIAKATGTAFGNARYARKLFEKIYMNHAGNVFRMDMNNPEYTTLSFFDVPAEIVI